MTSELERLVRVRNLPNCPITIEASEPERAALAYRFEIYAVHSLTGRIELEPDGKNVRARGQLAAAVEQECAISGDPFSVAIEEPLDILFVPAATAQPKVVADEEIELDADDLDRIAYSGDAFDLGEAIAQTLGLAIDPYAEGPNAAAIRAQVGIKGDDQPSGPLAEALAGLKKG